MLILLQATQQQISEDSNLHTLASKMERYIHYAFGYFAISTTCETHQDEVVLVVN
jgi:hypothetical protein